MTRKIKKKRAKRHGNGLLLDEAELATKLGETQRTIRHWRQSNIIPAIVTGYRSRHYILEDVLAALGRRKV
jgi:ribosome-binding protein aMBF1 (putative translation factor)